MPNDKDYIICPNCGKFYDSDLYYENMIMECEEKDCQYKFRVIVKNNRYYTIKP